MNLDFGRPNPVASAAAVDPEVAQEMVKLLRKLRWIGLEDEAESLQRAIGAIPASGRASILSWPASTD
jgi:hypothetical protein